MNNKTIASVIAIDGPAASGKGTIARALATHYDYAYLDTGALYRRAAYHTLQQGGDVANIQDALKGVAELKTKIAETNNKSLDGAIRTPRISEAAAIISALKDVRAAILTYQRGFAATPPHNKRGAILDGRDIGTIVCPDARCKLFITASAEVRAARRHAELVRAGHKTIELPQVLAEINARDSQDKGRKTAPLRQAADAHLLDTSDLSIEKAILRARHIIETPAHS